MTGKARVHASKTIETMLDNVSARTGIGREAQQQRLPGSQIVVIQGVVRHRSSPARHRRR